MSDEPQPGLESRVSGGAGVSEDTMGLSAGAADAAGSLDDHDADGTERPSVSHGSLHKAGGFLKHLVSALDRLKLEYIYLVVALVWGLALVVVTPPFQVPDEPAHFLRAWGLAEGQVFPPRDIKETLPSNVFTLPSQFPVGPILDPSPYTGYQSSKVLQLLKQPISRVHEVRFVQGTPSQNPLAYVPQAIGIWVAELARWSPMGAFYLARIFNLFAGLALVFLALRLVPFGKTMLLIVGLFPVTLSEMASVSPDSLMIGGAMLFTALVLNLSSRTTIRDRDMGLVLGVGVLLLTVKPSYFPLVALVFMLRRRQFASGKRFWIWVPGIAAAVLFVSIVAVLATPASPPGYPFVAQAPIGADMMAQFRHVILHPLTFANAMLNTFGASGISYGYWMVGLLGWLTINVSQVAVLVLLGLIVVFIAGIEGEPPVGARRRSVLLLTWLAGSVSVCLALYGAFSVVGGSTVNGVQGRYFTPVLPLLLLGVSQLKFRRHAAVAIILTVGLILVAIATLRAISFHYV
jgi:uncharacterized membrane protein